MILADTSVWIDHFRHTDKELQTLLRNDEIAMHPFVVGELALGSLPKRRQILMDLDHLPTLRIAQQHEVRQMIEAHALQGQGIGLIDTHLLASVLIHPGVELWTRDGSLRKIAAKLKVLCQLI